MLLGPACQRQLEPLTQIVCPLTLHRRLALPPPFNAEYYIVLNEYARRFPVECEAKRRRIGPGCLQLHQGCPGIGERLAILAGDGEPDGIWPRA